MLSCPPRLLRRALLIGLSLLLAQAAAAVPRVLVLGDSISAAYGMSLEEGWVARAQDALAERGIDARMINASISGETSAGGLRRLPALLEEHAPSVLIIELGGNDGLRGYPVASLRANLEHMIELARRAGASVLLLPMEVPPNYGTRYAAAFRASFPEAADSSGAMLGPFPLAGIATDPALMQEDGIHPQAAAQPRIVANVLPALIELLRP
jgi:acyl-CoA thioesterase-1